MYTGKRVLSIHLALKIILLNRFDFYLLTGYVNAIP